VWKAAKDKWPALALAALAVVIATIAGLGYGLRWAWLWTWLRWIWTGLETKSSWDWLELLMIPVVLGLGAFWFNRQAREREQTLAQQARKEEQELANQERKNDRRIAEDRAREDALQRYLDRMQELILDKKLRTSEEDAETRTVARARTLAVLRSLDGDRKGQVVRFLYEAGLIGNKVTEVDRGTHPTEPIIYLIEADLNGANLSGAKLSGATLRYANLSNANLRGA
jgi:hypothetical protein